VIDGLWLTRSGDFALDVLRRSLQRRFDCVDDDDVDTMERRERGNPSAHRAGTDDAEPDGLRGHPYANRT